MYNGCYLIPSGFQTYDVSQVNCNIMGGKLAEPINKEVDLGIALFVRSALGFDERYFVGITDKEKEGRFVLSFQRSLLV